MTLRHLSNWEVGYLIGFLNHSHIVQAIGEGSVSPKQMVKQLTYMNEEMWGGYEGCISWIKLREQDKELANEFLRQYRHENSLSDFYTKEEEKVFIETRGQGEVWDHFCEFGEIIDHDEIIP